MYISIIHPHMGDKSVGAQGFAPLQSSHMGDKIKNLQSLIWAIESSGAQGFAPLQSSHMGDKIRVAQSHIPLCV